MRLQQFLVMGLVAVAMAQSTAPWTLVWSDEFNSPVKTAVNGSNWNFEIGYIRNNEAQYYTDRLDNVFVEDGYLNIMGLHKPYDYNGGTAQYTSGSVYSTFSFTHGRVEARAMIPLAYNGTWPAFWLLGSNADVVGWPWCGEIDIMENVGFMPNILHGTIHDEQNNAWRGDDITNTMFIQNMSTQFVVYAVEWTPEAITFEVDGVSYLTVANDMHCWVGSWPYDNPFNIKLNLAIGGSWGGLHGIDPAGFPMRYLIDYVRVYQREEPQPPCVLYNYYLQLGVSTNTTWWIVRQLLGDPPFVATFTAQVESSIATLLGAELGGKVVVQALLGVLDGITGPGVTGLLINVSLVNTPPSTPGLAAALASASKSSSWLNTSALEARHAQASVLSFGSQCTWCQLAQNQFGYQNLTVPGNMPGVNYDYGGPEVGYHDVTAWNENSMSIFRSGVDWVDITLDDSLGMFVVNYIYAGEWLRYSSVYFPQGSSYYKFRLLASCDNCDPASAVTIELDGVAVGTVEVGSTDGYQWTSEVEVKVAGGRHAIRLIFATGGFTLSMLQINGPFSQPTHDGDGLSRAQMAAIVACATVFVVALVFFLWKRHRAARSVPESLYEAIPETRYGTK